MPLKLFLLPINLYGYTFFFSSSHSWILVITVKVYYTIKIIFWQSSARFRFWFCQDTMFFFNALAFFTTYSVTWNFLFFSIDQLSGAKVNNLIFSFSDETAIFAWITSTNLSRSSHLEQWSFSSSVLSYCSGISNAWNIFSCILLFILLSLFLP